jgi:porin
MKITLTCRSKDGMTLTSRPTRSRNTLWSAAAALIALAAFPALAADEGLLERDKLTGDWGGLRDKLAEHGIDLTVGYTGDLLGVASGGLQEGVAYQGRLELGFDADLEKLVGWEGGSFHASAYQIHGRGLSAEFLGNLLPTSNIEAVPSTRLFTLWLQQSFFDGAASIRAGQLAADDEFIVSDTAGGLINGTFGWFALAANNLPSGGPAYPLAAPGVRIDGQPLAGLTLRAAVFSGDPAGHPGDQDPQRVNNSGTMFSFEGGAFWIGEAELAVNKGKGGPGFEGGLPGTYKLGAWHHTGRFADQAVDDTGLSLADPASSGTPRTHRGDWGVYAVADQTVWREPGSEDQGATVFVRIGGAPAGRNLIDLYVDGGVGLKGLLPSRDNDVLTIGVAYARISGDARDLDRSSRLFSGVASPVRSYEAVIEVSYAAEVAPWLVVQPDLQYILNPGGHVADPSDPTGVATVDDALVLGVRTAITF